MAISNHERDFRGGRLLAGAEAELPRPARWPECAPRAAYPAATLARWKSPAGIGILRRQVMAISPGFLRGAAPRQGNAHEGWDAYDEASGRDPGGRVRRDRVIRRRVGATCG